MNCRTENMEVSSDLDVVVPCSALSVKDEASQSVQSRCGTEAEPLEQVPIVLVADDEEIVAETLVEILNSEGFKAVGVNDGTSAVDHARSLHPDIILADVLMPRLNGVEAARRIREFLPKARILLFSGHAETAELLEHARREGHQFEVLAKPLNPDTLLKILRTPGKE